MIDRINQTSTMNGDELAPIEEFLNFSSDGGVTEKWIAIMRKPPSNWKRLDVFDLWIRNLKGSVASHDFTGAKLIDLATMQGWNDVAYVHLYFVGRNRNNGYSYLDLKAAINHPFVEGVAIASNDSRRAFCVAHDGTVRVFGAAKDF